MVKRPIDPVCKGATARYPEQAVMRIGVSLLWLRANQMQEVARAAEDLGYESLWLSDHLVLPSTPAEFTAGHGQVPPNLPLYDVGGAMSLLASATTHVLLGTWVYVIPLRHPLTTARLFHTADLISGGRVRVGVGVGYIQEEFAATGIDFRTRGSRTDEAIEACRELWSGPDAQFHGDFFDFEHLTMVADREAAPQLPVLVGGESDPAFRRAARLGDGWLGGEFSPSTLVPVLSRLRSVEAELGRETPLEVTVGAGRITGRPDLPLADAGMIEEFETLGVDRVIVRPWKRSSEALEGLKAFAKHAVR